MCGIIGGICKSGDITPFLLSGLSRLEYRGYDSAGLAVADGDGNIQRTVAVGRVNKLRQVASQRRMRGKAGIAHTRWATHGAPTENNAHPICAGRVFVIHNGIIDNHAALRKSLQAAGRVFCGDTDTEVIAHLLDSELEKGGNLLSALREIMPNLQGAYALVAMYIGGDELVCARQGSPLLAGVGKQGVFVASDTQALVEKATRVHYFADGESARISVDGMCLYDANSEPAECAWQPLQALPEEVQLGEYRHFMQKEIFAQPDAVAATIEPFVSVPTLPMQRFGKGIPTLFRRIKHVVILACGTSYHAGIVARCWLAQFGISCRVEIASEYRYRPDPLAASSLCIAVSQSGETADTLSALRAAKAAGAATLALVNVETSTLKREADFAFCMRAGIEIGVASTKAFTAQLCALLLLTLGIAKAKKRLSEDQETAILSDMRRLPHLLRKALLSEEAIGKWAAELALAKSAIYIGRGEYHALALEGALKLKEISYIHAEGTAAGELKHGMLALVDADMPVIGIAPDNTLVHKVSSNLAEVAARSGRLFVLAGEQFQMEGANIIRLTDSGGEFLSPIVFTLPLQLLAYDTARLKGTDIDKPRNLAKSVTVE